MATQISFESFERLLQEDDVFIDYLNKFCSLPLYGQRIIYRKKLEKFICEPDIDGIVEQNKILKWIWETRLPFFFRSHIYAEYKLAKALIEYDLNEDGGVEDNIAKGMEQLQFYSFCKMSRFSKFCKFLSETGEGLKLVAFFIAAQHVFVAYYEGDPDYTINIGELRDKFFDETSYWCLPKKVLENFALTDQATSVAFCMTVSRRVLSRICLYWLPRYLLHLRMKEIQRKNEESTEHTTAVLHASLSDETREYLHDLVFRVQEMTPEIARRSVSTRGFDLLASNIGGNIELKKRSCILDPRDLPSTVDSENKKPDIMQSFTDLFPARELEKKREDGLFERKMTLTRRNVGSIAVPGCDIKVERKTSKRPTMAQLSSVLGLAATNESSNNDNFRTTQNRLHNIRETRRVNKESRMGMGELSKIGERTVSKSNMRKASGMRLGNQTASIGSPVKGIGSVISVTKAISKFKLARADKNSAADKNDKKVNTKQPKPTSLNKPRKDVSTANLVSPMKSVLKFKTADSSKMPVDPKEQIKEITEEITTDEVPRDSLPPTATKFSTVLKARNIGLKWAKKGLAAKKSVANQNSLDNEIKSSGSENEDLNTIPKTLKQLKSKIKGKEPEKPKVEANSSANAASGLGKSGLKMVFAMSDQGNDEKADQKTIKVITKKDNRLVSDVITENEEEAIPLHEDLPENYLRNRRNAVAKVKPVRTLRKRPHSQLPSVLGSKLGEKRTETRQTGQQNKKETSKTDIKATILETQLGKRKADFIKKALMVQTLTEKIKAPTQSKENMLAFGDNYLSCVYSMHEDQVYRHENRHVRAALRSDDFAAGPFMTYLTDSNEDESGIFALCFWQEIERFREEFSGMQQTDLLLTIDQIFTKYVYNDRGCQLIPGMQEIGLFLGEIEILDCLTFPWPLRLLQRKCMEYLISDWEEYIFEDAMNFRKAIGMDDVYELTTEVISNQIKKTFEEETAPLPDFTPQENFINRNSSSAPGRNKVTSPDNNSAIRITPPLENNRLTSPRNIVEKKSSGNNNQTAMRRTAIQAITPRITQADGPRSTMGYRESQIQRGAMTRAFLQENAMARMSKRAYLLSEQTCRLSAKKPESEDFLTDESDEEGFVPLRPPPVYLRQPKIDMKTLALLSAKEYPSKYRLVKKKTLSGKSDKEKAPSYMKGVIRKNGVVLKRPNVRPKHLVDCLKDPVHFEFFRRFAKTYHFERSVKFWKAVELMKHITDPSIRQVKIRVIVNQFFAKGATTGVGVDGQVLREIMRTPPEKVNVSMLISAQACVLIALEDLWGERYLSTFTDVKKTQTNKDRMNRNELIKMTQNNGKMGGIWRVFYAFIKRSAKFITSMKNRKVRQEFELYLQTIGRDPTVYHSEGWSEICASSYDVHMNSDLMYHQKKQQGRIVIAELLINDFRFWCEVECYRAQAEQIQQNGDNGLYNAIDDELLHDKAKLICDQFLNSPIPPKCRINIQSEISSTVIENVKLGMFNRSLFHDLTINIFPLLLNYWKVFCERRHKYVPRSDIRKFKRSLVLQRRVTEDKKKQLKQNVPVAEVLSAKIQKERKIIGDSPLIDYCSSKRFTQSWMDVTKTMEETPSMNFTLASGMRMTVPLRPGVNSKQMKMINSEDSRPGSRKNN